MGIMGAAGVLAALSTNAIGFYCLFAMTGWVISRVSLAGWMAFFVSILMPSAFGIIALSIFIFVRISGVTL